MLTENELLISCTAYSVYTHIFLSLTLICGLSVAIFSIIIQFWRMYFPQLFCLQEIIPYHLIIMDKGHNCTFCIIYLELYFIKISFSIHCVFAVISELLRKSAEHTLMDMVQLLFTRLPQFKEDPKWVANMKKVIVLMLIWIYQMLMSWKINSLFMHLCLCGASTKLYICFIIVYCDDTWMYIFPIFIYFCETTLAG